MAQWLRCWTHERKVMGSITGPDHVCVLEQETLFDIVTSKSWGLTLRYTGVLSRGGVLHSQFLNATEIGISCGLMSLKARDRL